MKRFSCSAVPIDYNYDMETAVDIGFRYQILDGTRSEESVCYDFDALEIGDSLTDEDGDQWTRTA